MNSSAASRHATLSITVIGMMSAMIFVLNYFRFPFLGTQVHMTNALCVLSGLLFGPAAGFLSSGIGSMLYDIVAGYGAECLITFVSKGAIGLIAGLIAYRVLPREPMSGSDHALIVLGSAAGAFAYVALYMLKTFIFGLSVNGLTMSGTLAKMLSKLPGSAINALFATIVAPIFYAAIRPALRRAGVLDLR